MDSVKQIPVWSEPRWSNVCSLEKGHVRKIVEEHYGMAKLLKNYVINPP